MKLLHAAVLLVLLSSVAAATEVNISDFSASQATITRVGTKWTWASSSKTLKLNGSNTSADRLRGVMTFTADITGATMLQLQATWLPSTASGTFNVFLYQGSNAIGSSTFPMNEFLNGPNTVVVPIDYISTTLRLVDKWEIVGGGDAANGNMVLSSMAAIVPVPEPGADILLGVGAAAAAAAAATRKAIRRLVERV